MKSHFIILSRVSIVKPFVKTKLIPLRTSSGSSQFQTLSINLINSENLWASSDFLSFKSLITSSWLGGFSLPFLNLRRPSTSQQNPSLYLFGLDAVRILVYHLPKFLHNSDTTERISSHFLHIPLFLLEMSVLRYHAVLCEAYEQLLGLTDS